MPVVTFQKGFAMQEGLTNDTRIIVAEARSRKLLEELKNSFGYGDEHHEFNFQVYSPARLSAYPGRFFLYVSYSERELRELYEKVDMTHRLEPVDQLEWDLRGFGCPYRTFPASNTEMVAKMGKVDFYPFLSYKKKSKLATLPEGGDQPHTFVMDEMFGKQEPRVRTKNVILIFCDENNMLQFLDLLLHRKDRPADSIRVGKMNDGLSGQDHWALAVRGVTNEPDQIREVLIYRDRDFEQIEHTDQIEAERHGFVEVENSHAKGIFERRKCSN